MLRTALIVTVLALTGCATTTKPANTAANATKPPCVTASRLPQPNCVSGSSYSQQDLNSTGQQDNNLGTSLRMLDPAIH
jgi:hypothetical protein